MSEKQKTEIEKLIEQTNDEVSKINNSFSQIMKNVNIPTFEINEKTQKNESFGLGFEKPSTESKSNKKINENVKSYFDNILNSKDILKINTLFQKNIIDPMSEKKMSDVMACIVIEDKHNYYEEMHELFSEVKRLIEKHIESIEQLMKSDWLELTEKARNEIDQTKTVKKLLNNHINSVLIALSVFENKIQKLKKKTQNSNHKFSKKCSFVVDNVKYNQMLETLNTIYKNTDLFIFLQQKCIENPIILYSSEKKSLQEMDDSKRDDLRINKNIQGFKVLMKEYISENMSNVTIVPSDAH